MYVNMEVVLRFNRIVKPSDYISPGSYGLLFDGKEVRFDFLDSERYSSEKYPTMASYVMRVLDTESFPESEALAELLAKKEPEKISEFFFYIGDESSSDLEVVSLEAMTLWGDTKDGCAFEADLSPLCKSAQLSF